MDIIYSFIEKENTKTKAQIWTEIQFHFGLAESMVPVILSAADIHLADIINVESISL